MNDKNDISREFKISRYHADEVKLVLFICTTDLASYHDDDLKLFAECIEGRIEVLLTAEHLTSIKNFIHVNRDTIENLLVLKSKLQKQYSGQWHHKMKTSIWKNEVFELSNEILEQLQIEYQEPHTFMKNHFEVDWK